MEGTTLKISLVVDRTFHKILKTLLKENENFPKISDPNIEILIYHVTKLNFKPRLTIRLLIKLFEQKLRKITAHSVPYELTER